MNLAPWPAAVASARLVAELCDAASRRALAVCGGRPAFTIDTYTLYVGRGGRMTYLAWLERADETRPRR